MTRQIRRLLLAWVALALLLAANIALAELAPTALALPANLAVAVVMVAIVLLIFMELDRSSPLLWVFAGAGFFWLAILFCLTAADYLTRYSYAPS